MYFRKELSAEIDKDHQIRQRAIVTPGYFESRKSVNSERIFQYAVYCKVNCTVYAHGPDNGQLRRNAINQETIR